MTVLDAIIIYLSIGAPFGVYSLFLRGRNGFSSVLRAAFIVLVWPFAAATLAISRMRARRSEKTAGSIKSDSLSIKNAEAILERALSALSDSPDDDRRDLGKLLNEYFDLSVMLQNSERDSAEKYHTFLSAAGNQMPSIGTVCLVRRNYNSISQKKRRALEEIQSRLRSGEDLEPFIHDSIAELIQAFEGNHEIEAERVVGYRPELSQMPLNP